VFAQAINWFLDLSKTPSVLTKISMRIQEYETLKEIMKVNNTKIDPVEDLKI
jgi:hypothetical protein